MKLSHEGMKIIESDWIFIVATRWAPWLSETNRKQNRAKLLRL